MYHHLVCGQQQVVTKNMAVISNIICRNEETSWRFVCFERKQTHLPRDGYWNKGKHNEH